MEFVEHDADRACRDDYHGAERQPLTAVAAAPAALADRALTAGVPPGLTVLPDWCLDRKRTGVAQSGGCEQVKLQPAEGVEGCLIHPGPLDRGELRCGQQPRGGAGWLGR